ncbi:type IV secretion system DNA-binding domain-containing protein [Ramlibacter sp. AN1133]|uniref:type IV secretion system DNA-binding domain-containing protein n=1 Tax=Ramlibacter sp. AN1133 TaxID=3133429 RepID=UPI0030C12B5E
MTRTQDIELRHELAIGQTIIDPRPATERFAEWLSEPLNLVQAALPTALATAIYPPLGLVTVPFLAGITLAHIVTKPVLPVRYPVGTKDDKGKPGVGIMLVGEIASSSLFENFKEIWLGDSDLRMHALILGSTGSGKSEALKSIFYNALLWSSGFFIADGKADNKLPTDVYTMVRSMGRDPDMLVLNFLLAGNTPEQVRRSRRRRTNKLNPFSSADADTIIQMGANLLPKVEGDAKNWQEKALNYWRSVVQALAYKRDTQGFELSVATFLEYMSLTKAEELYIEGYEEAQANHGEWSYGFAGLKGYLESGCPSYQVSKLLKKHGYGEEQVEQTPPGFRGSARPGKSGKETEQDSMAYEQHAYRTNQLIPVLNLLDKTYGFIFRDKYPEIDMTDVTLRNRILVMLIPSLEKSAAEAENLGKLAIACLRVMMSKNLGAEVEGDHEELLGSKATNSPYPYIVALDELAYYFSDGIAVMFAQARSLGTGMIAAAQDLEKLTEGSRSAEAGAMLANQVTKFFMRIDDTGKTADMIQKVVGKATVAVRRHFKYGAFGYHKTADIDVVEQDRISAQRLKRFKQGEGIIDVQGRTHYMRWFYMGKDIEKHQVDRYWVNRFLQVAPPSEEDVAANSIAVDEMNDPFRKGQELLRMLSQQVTVSLRVPHDPVVQAVADCAARLNPHLGAESRAIALYVAARNALRAVGQDPAAAGASRRGQHLAHKQAPRQGEEDGFEGSTQPVAQEPAEPPKASRILSNSQTEPQEDQSGEDPDFAPGPNPLAFLSPFVRKPAEEILGLEGEAAALPLPSPPQPMRERLGEVMRTARLYTTHDPRLRGKFLSKLVGAPEAHDPGTGLSLVPKADWISDAFEEFEGVLAEPRSSDRTVVGLTQPTLTKLEKVEELLDSPEPKAAAKSVERVVAVKVTPNTLPQDTLHDASDVTAFFETMRETLEPARGGR